jgi:uncharacterized membrane protein
MGERLFRVELSLFFWCIVIGGILLRLYQINYNLDGDEIFSVKATSNSFSHMMEVSIQDRPHPPLHNILLFFWIKVFGSSEVSVRMLSVLASFFFLLILYRLALLLMPKWSALFVLSICSFSSFFVYYGQQARPYSLACLFTILSVYLLFKNQIKSSTVNVVLYFFSCAALVYTQYIGVLILLPQLVAVVFLKTPEQRRLLFYGLAGTLSIVFWILFCSINAPITKGIIERVAWIEKPTVFNFVGLYIVAPFSLSGFSSIKSTIKVLVPLIALIIALIMSFMIIKHQDVNRRNIILLSALALFGPVVALTVSHYGPVSIWAPRQMIGSIIFFVYLIGLALALFRGWLRILLGLTLVVWCILNVPNAFPENSKPPGVL